jgi:hypothetical protein
MIMLLLGNKVYVITFPKKYSGAYPLLKMPQVSISQDATAEMKSKIKNILY